MDQFSVMSEWHYFAILSLLKTKDFESTPAFISSRLGISLQTAERSLDRMLRLNVIQKDASGNLIQSTEGIRTTDDLKDISIQKNHLQTLELAKKSLEEKEINERDFTSLTLPLDREDLPEAKRMIREFQNSFYERFNTGKKPKDVFRIGVQLFPLTQNPNLKLKKEKL